MKKTASEIGVNLNLFTILDAKDHISTKENPSKIIDKKDESSMAVGLKALNSSEIDAFITAGNTGALAVGSFFFNKKIKGVKRAGANLNCREDILLQFALMGDIYAKKILKIKNPKIGLANVGEEDTKGPKTHQAAYILLKNHKNLNFIGNIEARYIPMGMCDVVVCDGFSGNMILKTLEGTAKFLIKFLKNEYSKNLISKIAALMLKKSNQKLKRKIDYKNYGGAILLGMEKPIIKTHGDSNEKTIEKAIDTAIDCIKNNIISEIAENINI